MQIVYVARWMMPEGHSWALVEHRDRVTLYVTDDHAKRVALASLKLKECPEGAESVSLAG